MSPPAATDADHQLAADIARETGRLLVDLRHRLAAEGVEGRTLKDEGDRQAHEYIVGRLNSARPDDGLLSEEGVDDQTRLEQRRVWIVDPLDGTREFSEPPRIDWAVHVAMAIDGDPVVGAVALPAEELLLSTAAPEELPTAHPGPPRLVVSRTRPPAAATHVAGMLDGELVPMGSAGAKVMAVLLGRADVYAHSGGQYEWDSCAPIAVAQAFGAHTSRVDGSPLRYNRADPYLPDLLVCRPELAEASLGALATFEAMT
jgi:3'(2'), 5'-bisphosphate nucleotidase